MTLSPLGKNLNDFVYTNMFDKQYREMFLKQRQVLHPLLKKHSSIMKENRNYANMSMKDRLKINAERFRMAHKIVSQSSKHRLLFRQVQQVANIGSFSLNTAAFLITIQLLGSSQQVKYWQDLIFDGKIIGAYGQTQLGHGSNVQGLQTEAHYEPQTQTFRLCSPKNSSSKFWPGILGIFATHSVVQAKTFIGKKYIGIQTFVVQIRNNKLQNLPGIDAGDIGAKCGFQRVDNGYLLLDNYSIPRKNMLMKYIQIHKDGKIDGLQNKQAIKYGYGSMLNLRVRLTNGFALHYVIRAVVEQYSICKKLNILDNQDIKKQIIQNLCTGYGILIANLYTKDLFLNFLSNLKAQKYNQADEYLIQTHIISSTFKACSSFKTMNILPKLISFNYLSHFRSSIIADHFTDSIPTVTYQGDNSVLLQQTAKYVLMKQGVDQQKIKNKPELIMNPHDLKNCLKVLQYVSMMQTQRIQGLFDKQTENNIPLNIFWNQKYQRQIIDLSKLWGMKSMFFAMIKSLQKLQSYHDFYEKIAKVFSTVILNQDVPVLSFYGFTVEKSNLWNTFTKEQINAMLQINFLLEVDQEMIQKYQKHSIPQRNSDWTRPRL